MSNNLKTKDLLLFSIININQLYKDNNLENAELVDFTVAWNQNIYLLIVQPSKEPSKDWLIAPFNYIVVEIKINWIEQRVLETKLFHLGILKFQFHFLRLLNDNFLLLGARSAYREQGPDSNAWIISRNGTIQSRFCLGDGIENCIVKKDGTIITGYFDEGIFGNYGQSDPIGKCGLIAWTSDGTAIWKNDKYPIYDCYAISLDNEENLWFYYYDDFSLVKTNFKEDLAFDHPLTGSMAFSIAPCKKVFLFQGGYQEYNKFYFFSLKENNLELEQEAILMCNNNRVIVKDCCMLSGSMLFLGEDNTLYGWEFEKN